MALKASPSGKYWPVLSSVAAPGPPSKAKVPLLVKVAGTAAMIGDRDAERIAYSVAIGVGKNDGS